MDEIAGGYKVGRGKPPLHSRFKKGQSGNPRGPRPKNLPALLVRALDEPVVVTTDGHSRQITRRSDLLSLEDILDPPWLLVWHARLSRISACSATL